MPILTCSSISATVYRVRDPGRTANTVHLHPASSERNAGALSERLSDRTHEGHEDAGHDHEDHEAPSLKEIRAQVSRTAKQLGINYTVLMDESNEVGGRFNGGELPTTVLVDPQGNVRRRFVGDRALPLFEAMLAEVLQPSLSSAIR